MDEKRPPPTDREVRCTCGSLMARMTASGVELKCRRCKRVVLVALGRAPGGWIEVNLR